MQPKDTSSDVQALLTHVLASHLLMLHWPKQVTWPCQIQGKQKRRKKLYFFIGPAATSYVKRVWKQGWDSFIVAIFANNLSHLLMTKFQSYNLVLSLLPMDSNKLWFYYLLGFVVVVDFTYIFSITMNSWDFTYSNIFRVFLC